MRSDRSENVRTFARLLLVLAIASTIGCAQKDWIDRTLVTVDVTGTWQGTHQGTGMVVEFELKQEGSTVKGFMRMIAGSSQNVAGVRDGPIVGTVAGDVFRFEQPTGRAEGELRVVSEDEMEGRASIQFGVSRLILRRVRPPLSQEGSPPPR